MPERINGRFAPGNSGRKKGSKNKRNEAWDALAGSIMGKQSEEFNKFLEELWTSDDRKDKLQAAELYLKTIEYFKPKQARLETTNQHSILDDKIEVIIKTDKT